MIREGETELESKISIIVPVYNAEQFLQRCLDSLVKQTYSNIEIICINDGSKDESFKILAEAKEQDDRIKVIDKPNSGVSDTRNCGLSVATGKYILFVDSDDWLDLDTCEIALKNAIEHDADVVMWSYCSEHGSYSNPKKIFPSEHVFEKAEVYSKLYRRFVGIIDEELAHPELADSLCPVWGKMYKREVIETSGAKFVDLATIGTYEDGLFNLEVFRVVKRAVYLDASFYHYNNLNTGSVTSGYRDKLFGQWKTLFSLMRDHIVQNELPEPFYRALNNRIALSVLGLGFTVAGADISILAKIKMLRRMLCDSEYDEALHRLDFSHFPFYWKLFYGCAKYKISVGIVLLIKSIQIIRSRK